MSIVLGFDSKSFSASVLSLLAAHTNEIVTWSFLSVRVTHRRISDLDWVHTQSWLGRTMRLDLLESCLLLLALPSSLSSFVLSVTFSWGAVVVELLAAV